MSDINRRMEERFPHRAPARFEITSQTHEAHLLNISKNGALIAVLAEHNACPRDRFSLSIETSRGCLTLTGYVAHTKSHFLGLRCEAASPKDQVLVEEIISYLRSNNASEPVT